MRGRSTIAYSVDSDLGADAIASKTSTTVEGQALDMEKLSPLEDVEDDDDVFEPLGSKSSEVISEKEEQEAEKSAEGEDEATTSGVGKT